MESIFERFFSSTDSAIDVEGEFQHNLKLQKKKRRKRKSNLSLNQSRRKKKKINYGKLVKIKNCDSDDEDKHSDGDAINSVSVSVESNEFNAISVERITQKLTDDNDNVNSATQGRREDEISERNRNEHECTYLENCVKKCKEQLITQVIENFDKEGLLIYFMAFMNMIANGQISVANMAVLLCMELALLFSLASTTQMRYREDTELFWEVVLSVGGPRTLRLFSSDKHQGSVNSAECEKSKYNPQKGSFNFAVPDEKILKRSRTGLPKLLKCGIIEESLNFLDMDKEYVLALDGKQASPGLIDEMEGDVNLWGYEGPTTLQENMECLHLQENVIINVVDKASSSEVDFKFLGTSFSFFSSVTCLEHRFSSLCVQFCHLLFQSVTMAFFLFDCLTVCAHLCFWLHAT